MADKFEKEWALIREQNLLAGISLEDLARAVEARQLGPLEILLQDGLLSVQTVADLRHRAAPSDHSTAFPDALPVMAEATDRPPVFAWKHYQIVRFLGAGGMGRVFLARDTRLQRSVAVKFLRTQDVSLTSLLLGEARAQARVEHPTICQVFEVDEVEGHAFIAMQYIDGVLLGEAGNRMNLEQKLLLMAKVAFGVHEAHKTGLVHRDLTPRNIMVCFSPDGEAQPFIFDFGLAGLNLQEGDWQAGAGTPGFMAPEQKGGDLTAVDRRTDVYALGAVLHTLFVGHPPPTPQTGDETGLARLQAALPDLPREVAAIIAQCLAARPGERYATARALGDDLNAFLAGDPVKAVAGGWHYRMRKTLVRHRLPFASLALVILLLVSMLGWGVQQRRQAAEQTRLARVYTGQVKDLTGLARLSHLSRAHDIRPDRLELNRRMDEIRDQLPKPGHPGYASGHYALGRGYLVQNRLEEARTHLELAWQSDAQTHPVAYALGLTYVGLYRKHLPRIYMIANQKEREAVRNRLRQDYLAPALTFMKQVSVSDAASPQYLGALIAFSEGRHKDALALITKKAATDPWFYEPVLLEADLYREMADAAGENEPDERVRHLLDLAEQAYERALDIAPSDPQLYTGLLYCLLLQNQLEKFTGESLDQKHVRALDVLESFALVAPENSEAQFLAGKLHLSRAKKAIVEERDPSAFLDEALEAAGNALNGLWEPDLCLLLKADIHWEQANWLSRRQQDPSAALGQTVAALNRVRELERGETFYNLLARANRKLGDWERRVGETPCHSYAAAIKAYRMGSKLRPDLLRNYSGLGNALMNKAAYGGCGPPDVAYREAAESLKAALALNPNHAVLHYQIGRVYWFLAGGDTENNWDRNQARKAEQHFLRAIELKPKLSPLYTMLSRVYLDEARFAWRWGQAYESFFKNATDTLSNGLEQHPNSRVLTSQLAWTFYFRGKFRIRDGGDPDDDLKRAIQMAQKALEKVRDRETLLILASAYRIQAEYLFEKGADPGVRLRQAQDLLEEIQAEHPKYFEASRSLGRLHTLRARHLKRQGEDPGPALLFASEALARALALEPDQVLILIGAARLAYYRAIWQDSSFRAEGLDLIKQALVLCPEDVQVRQVQKALVGLGNLR